MQSSLNFHKSLNVRLEKPSPKVSSMLKSFSFYPCRLEILELRADAHIIAIGEESPFSQKAGELTTLFGAEGGFSAIAEELNFQKTLQLISNSLLPI